MGIIEISNVSKSYKKVQILNNVSIEILENEIFGLLGPNGAGKSTLAKILTGYYSKDAGKIKVFGKEFDSDRNAVLKKIGIVPQEEQFYSEFSVRENIEFFGSLYGLDNKKLLDSTENLLNWLNLKEFEKRKSKTLSGGYRRLLNIACSLVHDPQIVYLDEPTVGLDPNMRRIFWQKIKELKEMRKTVCLTTHYMDEAERLCDRIALVVKGQILVTGKPKELIKKFGGQMTLKVEVSNDIAKEVIAEVTKYFPQTEILEKNNVSSILVKSSFNAREFSKISSILGLVSRDETSFDFHEPTLEDVFFNLTGEKQEVTKVEYSQVHPERN